ncbi:MAG: DUF4157 domain-containing protein [Deltaproteobacteria bacterium]|nr:DUF4157 domain-containing protein [Deltaproteobacteria bacterium]MCP5007158.1 DUF4157 domain-containing protein [Planctomycetota bacterium]
MNKLYRKSYKRSRARKRNRISRSQNNDLSESKDPSADHIMQLQRTIGNQAVQRLIKTGTIQAKLRTGRSNDKYEQDVVNGKMQMADGVSLMADSGLQRQPQEDEYVRTKSKSSVISPEIQIQKQEEGDEIRKQPEEKKEDLQAKKATGGKPKAEPNLEDSINSIRGGGRPLPKSTRSFFESRFGHDFSNVRVHTDEKAAQMSKSLKARAFTIGNNIVFGAGQYTPETKQGNRLLGHELAHVNQQENKGRLLRRYESGEHARLGEDRSEFKASLLPIQYTVRKGDTLLSIAVKFAITVAELKAANKGKLHRRPATDGSRRVIEGFNVGEIINIPKKLKNLDLLVPRYKVRFTLNGVVLDYGAGIAMGVFFESPEQMAGASGEELKELAALIKREQSGGKPISTEEWQKATRGKYLKLAGKNEAHFAPPDPELVETSIAGAESSNHMTEWEKHHKAAIEISIAGDKDKALMTNAFADHFLTDAFSAGHLVNKRDVMEKFKSQLLLDPTSNEFTNSSKEFFDAIARDAFTGSVKTEFSKYESYIMGGYSNIDTVDRFSTLLQGIHKEDAYLMANAVAKGVHDKLNTIPDGISVENEKGHKWRLSDDSTLNATTTEIAKWAVARSQRNIISSYKHPDWIDHPDRIDYPDMYKSVWDYTPKPDTAGAGQLVGVVKKGTDVKGEELKKEVVEFIEDNYKLLIDDLVKRKVLKKA